ncbi:LOW QUALITY PROTEIN: hypothetical protein HID58_069154, partial [Brassica napus]
MTTGNSKAMINNLPDVILQHILCFIPTKLAINVILQHIPCFVPTKLAISTSILSRRWRHVWCDIPSISLVVDPYTAASVNETLTRYTAPKTKSFHLTITPFRENIPYIDIESISFQISYTTVLLSSNSKYILNIRWFSNAPCLGHPYRNSLMNPWLRFYQVVLLENLTLYDCWELKVLDLSKSLRLRTLEVNRTVTYLWPTQIVAPHIHCLGLFNSELSSKLEIALLPLNPDINADFLQVRVLEMLDVDKYICFWDHIIAFSIMPKNQLVAWISILYLAEIRGVPFPILKVKTLTLDTKIFQYVIPVVFLDIYLKFEGFNLKECGISKDGNKYCMDIVWIKPMHVASFVKLMLKNRKNLDTMVKQLDELYLTFKNIPYIDRLIKFAMSHNFENLSLDLCSPYEEFKLPDFFYNSSPFKQLKIYSHKMFPTALCLGHRCRNSLMNLWLRLYPVALIENLTLYDCYKLKVLDLSKSLRLRTLVVNRNMGARGPRQ